MYWLPDHPELFWAPCKLIKEEGDKLLIKPIASEDEEIREIEKSKAMVVHPTCNMALGNLLDLGEFNEGALLHTIRARFYDHKIYTNIGQPILLAVNPYMQLTDLFTSAIARDFRKVSN